MDGNETAGKIALAGALMAGFAYFGYSILRDAFTTNSGDRRDQRSGRRRHRSDSTDVCLVTKCVSDLSHASSQTDLTLPIGFRHRKAFKNIPPELWSPWAKTIEERIRDLNIRLVNSTPIQFKRSVNHFLAPNKGSMSLGNSPKHLTPGRQSPEVSPNSFFSSRHSTTSHDIDGDDCLTSSRSAVGVQRVLDLCLPSETEILIHKRILEKLFGKSTPNLSQQDSQSLTILLMSRDEELIIKTLSVVANCCAFSVNIDTICDSGCVPMIYELLANKSKTIQIAATNAVANVANGERAQELLKDCIPLLLSQLMTSDTDLLTNWTLRALANLALKDCNQILMIAAISHVMSLLSHTNPTVRLHAIKLLVNFSCNSQLVPYLLASKAPNNLYSLLDSSHDIELVLRITNFLANVIDITCLHEIKAKDLPIEYKASSPETLYSAIYGFEATELLLKKLNDLQSIPHEDVVFQVKRILKKVR